MKNSLLWIVLGLLLLGVWWSLSSPPNEELPKSTPDASIEIQEVEPATDLLAADRSAPKSLQRKEAILEDQPPLTDSFLVTVIRKDTKEVLPNFKVTWLEVPKDIYYPTQEWDSRGEAEGTVARTNDSGQFVLAQSSKNIILVAKDDGLYGRFHRSYRATGETVELEVLPDQSMTVKVQHFDGTPAEDYRVVYAERYGKDGSRESSYSRSDKRGIAVLEHIQIPMAYANLDNVQCIAIGLPAQEPLVHNFSIAKGVPETMEFTLPVTGRVKVVAKQHDGSPFPEGTKIHVQKGKRERFNPNHLGGFDVRLNKDGSAEFPVGLNISLEYSIYSQTSRQYFSAVGLGPTQPGETVVLALNQREAPSSLVGRLLTAEGEPLVNAKLRGRIRTRSMSMGKRISTDANGQFHIPIRTRKLEPGDDDDPPPFRFLNVSYLHPDGIQIWCHLIDLSFNLEAGENDLGDVQLSSDLLASGIVIDSQTKLPLNEVDLRFGGESLRYQRWNQNPFHLEYVIQSFFTNDSGRFEARGNLAIQNLQSPAEKKGYLPHQFSLSNGIADQVFTLDSGEGMRAKVVLDPQIPHHEVRLKLIGVGEKKGTTWGMSFAQDEDEYATSLLPIGDFEIQVLTELDQIVIDLGRFHIEPDSPQDPRLDPIDLRGLIFARTIHVTGPLGEDPDYFMIATEDDLDGTRKANHSITLTPYSIWTPYLWSDSKEVRPQIQSAQSEVPLEPAMQALIRFEFSPQLPDGSQVSLRIYRKEDREYQQSAPVNLLNPVLLNFRAPGIYALELEYVTEGSRHRKALQLNSGIFEIEDSLMVQEFSFQVSEAERQ